MFFTVRLLRDGAKPARLINCINFSSLPAFPLFYFQIFSQSIFTKKSMYFSPSICVTKQVQNNRETLRFVIPVVCVTNEREENIVKQHN